EIGRAQAVQAEACGLRPVAEHNPILLKPSGGVSQLVLLGQPGEHIRAGDYYQHIDRVWEIVRATLEGWHQRCDVLLLEGAGSPVELNLMHRDIVNLKPMLHLDGRWLLIGDIERGGIFAQAVGTHTLMPPEAQSRGLGFVVNKFRGDLSLFGDADRYFAKHLPDLPYLGTLPYRADLQVESEDSLCEAAEASGTGAKLAWLRFPHLSNSQDSQPWQLDTGIRVDWVRQPADLANARAIVLPGSKNTIADLLWLRETGLGDAILQAAAQGIPIVGICGGYQMLGRSLADPEGVAGAAGTVPGLGLLPAETVFSDRKTVRQVRATWQGHADWMAYEIHMGRTHALETVEPLLAIKAVSQNYPEGMQQGAVWGTYLHGLFESGNVRQALTNLAGITDYRCGQESWQDRQRQLFDRLADFIDAYLDLTPIREYLDG
ncbi:MAG: cobyric acid synthase, partial [Cyanobacteria bacterium J06641_5]